MKSAYSLTSDGLMLFGVDVLKGIQDLQAAVFPFQVASALKGAGYTADQVAGALTSVYNLSADQIAGALKTAGYPADQIASVLKDTFSWSAGQVAGFLKESMGLGDNDVNSLLQGAGYAGDQINSAMHDVYNWGQGVGDALNPTHWHLP